MKTLVVHLSLAALCCVCIGLNGCSNENEAPDQVAPAGNTSETTVQDLQQDVGEAMETAVDLGENTKNDAVAQLKKQVADFEQRIENLQARTGDLKKESQEKWDAMIKTLKKDVENLKTSLNLAGQATGDKWEETKKQLMEARERVVDALAAAEKELTEDTEEK